MINRTDEKKDKASVREGASLKDLSTKLSGSGEGKGDTHGAFTRSCEGRGSKKIFCSGARFRQHYIGREEKESAVLSRQFVAHCLHLFISGPSLPKDLLPTAMVAYGPYAVICEPTANLSRSLCA